MEEEKKELLETLGEKLLALAGETKRAGVFRETCRESGQQMTYSWSDAAGKETVCLTFLTRERDSGVCEITQKNYLKAEISLRGKVEAVDETVFYLGCPMIGTDY